MLRALGLGDLLVAVPALRGLRTAVPGHEIVLAAPQETAELLRAAGLVDAVLDFSGVESLGPHPPPWNQAPPGLAVDLHGRGPQSHRLLTALQPHRLVAFACAAVGNPGPPWRSDEHEAARWARLVADTFGVTCDPCDVVLPAPVVGSPEPGAVVLHPGAAHRSRQWPVDRFAAVARALSAAGERVVLTGTAAERQLAVEVAVAAGLDDSALLAGTTSLATLAALVAEARLVVCGDTGVAHLASAYATPSVLLFGPTAPARWGPPSHGPHTVIWKGNGAGDPLGELVDTALLSIDVDEVLHHIAQRLAG